MIYTVTFNPALDYIIHLPRLIPGEVNRSDEEQILWGGKGINVSRVLRELKYESTALGFIAGFTGEALAAGLEEQGIRTDFIRLSSGMTRINVKLKAQTETDLNARGPVIGEKELLRLEEKLLKLEKGDVLVLSGSIPAGLPQDIYEKIMQKTAHTGCRTVVDATRELLGKVLPLQPFLIKPNAFELAELFGVPVPSRDEDLRQLAAKAREQGARNVLVSMAGDGAMLLDETGEYHRISAPSGRVQNSVGAGDSMVAGFLAGYLQTGDFSFALKLATAAGSATAFSVDLASGDEIRSLLALL